MSCKVVTNGGHPVLEPFRCICPASCPATFTTNTWATSSTRCGATSSWTWAVKVKVRACRQTATAPARTPARAPTFRWAAHGWHFQPPCWVTIMTTKSRSFRWSLSHSWRWIPVVPSLQQGAKKAAIKILKNFDEAITVDVASLDPEMLYQRPYAGWVHP